jgi:hypothetical protein
VTFAIATIERLPTGRRPYQPEIFKLKPTRTNLMPLNRNISNPNEVLQRPHDRLRGKVHSVSSLFFAPDASTTGTVSFAQIIAEHDDDITLHAQYTLPCHEPFTTPNNSESDTFPISSTTALTYRLSHGLSVARALTTVEPEQTCSTSIKSSRTVLPVASRPLFQRVYRVRHRLNIGG